jgi:hypothetical protein
MDGKLFTVQEGYTSVANGTHPAVKKTIPAAAAQGVLPGGMLVAFDGSGNVIPYNRSGSSPTNVLKGVLDKEIDTAKDTAAIVILHGTVTRELLVHGAASGAVTAPDIAALEAIGIWAQ